MVLSFSLQVCLFFFVQKLSLRNRYQFFFSFFRTTTSNGSRNLQKFAKQPSVRRYWTSSTHGRRESHRSRPLSVLRSRNDTYDPTPSPEKCSVEFAKRYERVFMSAFGSEKKGIVFVYSYSHCTTKGMYTMCTTHHFLLVWFVKGKIWFVIIFPDFASWYGS